MRFGHKTALKIAVENLMTNRKRNLWENLCSGNATTLQITFKSLAYKQKRNFSDQPSFTAIRNHLITNWNEVLGNLVFWQAYSVLLPLKLPLNLFFMARNCIPVVSEGSERQKNLKSRAAEEFSRKFSSWKACHPCHPPLIAEFFSLTSLKCATKLKIALKFLIIGINGIFWEVCILGDFADRCCP